MFNNKLEFKFKEEMDGVVNHAEHRIDSVRKKFCENVNSKFDELISTPETGVDEIALLKREKIRFNLKFPEYAQNKELTQ